MLKDYGVPYTTFELSDRIGGNWAFQNPNGLSSAYRSLHIDTSKHRLSFKDFPVPEDFPAFPHHTEIKRYLDDYAEAFGLLEGIEFNNGVVRARPTDDGWDIEDQTGAIRHFDLLVVGNGHHWDARTPEFPGEFTGETIHSHHYIDPNTPLQLTGKRILVVGIGNSAADITVELSSKSLQNTVTLSTRSSAWIVPKYLAGQPGDKFFKTTPYLPLAWQRKAAQLFAPMVGADPTRYGLPPANHKLFEAHPTQSVELPLRLGSGDIIPKPNVRQLDGQTVHFEDGTSADFDAIVYATGYNITFPFFDPGFLSAPENHIRLYKRMFVPGIDNLVFIGFAQAIPTLFPFVECQSRLLAAYAVGRYALPSVAESGRCGAACCCDGPRCWRNQGFRAGAICRVLRRGGFRCAGLRLSRVWHLGRCVTPIDFDRRSARGLPLGHRRGKTLPGVDPQRVVLWGSSLSGGHVIRVAAGRDDIAAVIAMTPMTDVISTSRAVLKQYPATTALRSTLSGALSRMGGALGRAPITMPLVSRTGGGGALALDGCYESYLSIAGPSWRNEVDAAVGLELAKIRTKSYAKRLGCPLLVQIADFDRFVPADSAQRTAVHGRAQVHHYPCDHFDVWPGHDWFDRAVDDQLRFLRHR